MSKYIDSRESVDIDKVEEAFKAGYAEAERKAREEARGKERLERQKLKNSPEYKKRRASYER